MENVEKDTQEIQDLLLSELNSYNYKINISKILITIILIIIPTVLIINIIGLINDLVVSISFLGLTICLLYSVRMYNYNKILYITNIWILDCMINKKPLR